MGGHGVELTMGKGAQIPNMSFLDLWEVPGVPPLQVAQIHYIRLLHKITFLRFALDGPLNVDGF